MSKTPEQTIIDTSVDPSLSYLQAKQVGQLISTENGIITTRTDKGTVVNTLENVTKVLTKVVETNVLADWSMNDPENTSFIRNKPNLGNYYTKSEADATIASSISNLINGAPTALNTLNELANALGNNASYASTITNELANKADSTYVDGLFNTIANISTGNVTFTDTTIAPSDNTANIVINIGAGNEFVFDTNGTLTIPNSIAVSGNGSPVFSSANDFSISAENRVKILNGSFKLAAKTSGERALLLPQPGDMIFHVESNQVQVYANGSWVPLGTGVANQSLNTDDDATFDGITLTSGFVNFPTGGEVYTNNNGSIDLYTDWDNGGVEVWLKHDDKVLITTSDGSNEWSFDKTGNLAVPSNIVFPQLSPQELNASPAPVLSGIVFSDGTIQTTAPVNGNPFDQSLNTTDSATFNGLSITNGSTIIVEQGTEIHTSPNSTGSIDLYTDWNSGNASEVYLEHDSGVYITTASGTHQWSFDRNGIARGPHNVTQQAIGPMGCLPNQDTVIYTGTDVLTSTIKALFHVEGTEDGTQNYEAQSCEMMVARMNTKVAGSVYGLAYTSTGPLATINARINVTSGLVEITCRPTSTTNAVYVTTTATELLTTP